MNFGQFLIERSTLPTGTVRQHLLALQTGLGTVFVTGMAVRLEATEASYVREEVERVVSRSALPDKTTVRFQRDGVQFFSPLGAEDLHTRIPEKTLFALLETSNQYFKKG